MIQLDGVYKSYKNKSVLINMRMEIEDGEFVVLIGSSGCGKTTLLKSINRLHEIDAGHIRIDGQDIAQMDPVQLRRSIGYVVQDGGLFPHLTVAENIGLILQLTGMEEDKRNERVDALLNMVNLDPAAYRELNPSQLSGGQRQRVGVARAFATDPKIILMDEPFSALDPLTRAELQDEIYRLQTQYEKTVLFVTHDMDEAIKLADRICIIENGQIVQFDTPEQILKHPANAYVERFVGRNKLWSNPDFIQARDVMRLRPYAISIQRTVVQAVQIMKQHSIDSILITDHGRLRGIVYLKDLNIGGREGRRALADFIQHDFLFVYDDTSLSKILQHIDYRRSGIIPVITHDHKLAGYLTKSILLATLAKQYEQTPQEALA